jgi:hypothetical protein
VAAPELAALPQGDQVKLLVDGAAACAGTALNFPVSGITTGDDNRGNEWTTSQWARHRDHGRATGWRQVVRTDYFLSRTTLLPL